jgi:glycosyltransferase involved in cell wall biosynthesis
MRFVFASYIVTDTYSQPEAWLYRIRAYTGMLEALSATQEVISIEQINYEGDYVKDGVQYKFKRFGYSRLRRALQLNRYIKSLNPDVVFIQSLHFPVQVTALRWQLGVGVKIMVQNHAERPFIGIKKYLQRFADRYINAYLFASQQMGIDWVEKGNFASTQKIHEVMEVSSVFHPVDRLLAVEKTGVSGQAYLWVGRLNENKDPLNVVNAFIDFAEQHPDARLYMLYHTEELLSELKLLLDERNAHNSVILIGEIPNAGLLYWYNSVNFIVSGSHYEGSGTAICEAMSCGCIPVVTDIFSFRAMTDGGRCGILYPPGDRGALLSVLIATTKMDVSLYRQRSLDSFRKNLSFEAIAQKIQDIAGSL